ncbi:MAG TPA: HNH endonuclease [Candidatus Limicola stercorigallinarum]|nr:HNH endonuclease [Candidatus Limicola stercorigallinarum]
MGHRKDMGRVTSDMLRAIPGCPHYLACSDGRILSLYSMSWLEPHLDKSTGYLHVSISEEGKVSTRSVHRLIAEAFLPKESDMLVVNHKDEDKLNNTPGNLEWATVAENIRYGTARKRASETAGIEALRESAARAREIRSKRHERPVVNIDTGRVFPSIRDAAHAMGLRKTGIWGACNKRQKTCGGYRWAYEVETAL